LSKKDKSQKYIIQLEIEILKKEIDSLLEKEIISEPIKIYNNTKYTPTYTISKTENPETIIRQPVGGRKNQGGLRMGYLVKPFSGYVYE